MLVYSTMTEAWNNLYTMLEHNGERVQTRNGFAKHLVNVSFCLMNPLQNLVYSKARKMSTKYLIAELVWYLKGDNRVDFIGKYAKMWNTLTDDGKTVNSAYGHMIQKRYGFDQLEYVINLLKKDKYSRQAIIHFKTPTDVVSKDVPCTVSMQFMVHNGKVHGHVYMRSNDIWFGTPYDVAFFALLLQIVAYKTNIPLGYYHHTVGDLHLYENNVRLSENDYSIGPDFFYYDSMLQDLENYLETGNETKLPIALRRLKIGGKL